MEDIHSFYKNPPITLFLHEIFRMKNKWKMSDEIKCKPSEICM